MSRKITFPELPVCFELEVILVRVTCVLCLKPIAATNLGLLKAACDAHADRYCPSVVHEKKKPKSEQLDLPLKRAANGE